MSSNVFSESSYIITCIVVNFNKVHVCVYLHDLGIEYSLGRIPMASCDFSTHPYSYDDNDGDFNLTKFSLTTEDYKYKVGKILFLSLCV